MAIRSDLTLRRKITLVLGGRRFVLVKKPGESIEHVIGKAAAVHFYLERYPDLKIEVGIGDTYKPDVVQLDSEGRPVFWAESGKVGKQKLTRLFRRYPATRFVFLRFGRMHAGFVSLVRGCLPSRFQAEIELLGLPPDVGERIADGTLRAEDCELVRISGSPHQSGL